MKTPLYIALFSVVLTACSVDTNEQGITSKTEDSSAESARPTDEGISYIQLDSEPFHPEQDQNSREQDYTSTFNSSNKNNSQVYDLEEFSSSKDILKSLAAPAQVFNFSSDEPVVLIGEKGTNILIKPNSFEQLDGTEAEGQITLLLKECFEYDDMLYENLTTLSKGELLETGGMLHLECWSDGKKLKLKEFEEVEVRFPGELSEDMNLFYGSRTEDEQIDWEIDELAKAPYPTVINTYNKYGYQASPYFVSNYKLEKSDMVALAGDIWDYEVAFSTDGYEVGRKFEPMKNQTSPQKHANEKFYELIARSDFRDLDLKFPSRNTRFEFTIGDAANYFDETAKAKVKRILGRGVVLKDRVQKKGFFIGGLGWLNADMYVRPPGKKIPVSDILVKVDHEATDYRMAFKNRKSLIFGELNEDGYLFKNVPIGDTVVVIGTYVHGETAYLGTQDVIVGMDDTELITGLAYEAYPDLNAFHRALSEFKLYYR